MSALEPGRNHSMAVRQKQDRDRHDHDRGRLRDFPPRAGDDARRPDSERPFGNRADYGWRGETSRDYSGIGFGISGGHADDGRVHHSSAGLEAGYMEYGRNTYGGPYGAQRFGAREWSSSERWRVPGPHAGRGPRGYQRSDERILE